MLCLLWSSLAIASDEKNLRFSIEAISKDSTSSNIKGTTKLKKANTQQIAYLQQLAAMRGYPKNNYVALSHLYKNEKAIRLSMAF